MPRVTTPPSSHAQTPHSFNPCPPAQLALRTALSANVLSCLLEKKGNKTRRTDKDKASHAILGKAVWSESVAQRWLERGMKKLHWNRFRNLWKSHDERRRFPSQSQPLSFIMWDSSMMYFPSLYFWLSSKACSCRRKVKGVVRKREKVRWQMKESCSWHDVWLVDN